MSVSGHDCAIGRVEGLMDDVLSGIAESRAWLDPERRLFGSLEEGFVGER